MRCYALPAAVLLGLLATGCQQKDMAERMEKTEALICSQLADVGTALEGVEALTPQSTIGEARAANQALSAAVETLEASKEKLENLQLKAFKEQLGTFREEAARVARQEGLTLQEAATELKAKAKPVLAARAQLASSVECEESEEPAKSAP